MSVIRGQNEPLLEIVALIQVPKKLFYKKTLCPGRPCKMEKEAIAEDGMVDGHQIKKNVFLLETFSLHMWDQSCKSAEV